MFDFIRTAAAVPVVCVGDINFNCERIKEKITEAEKQNVDFIVFPELSLCGYTCGDLFLQDKLLTEAEGALRELVQFSRNVDVIAIIGVPIKIQDDLYNCAAVVYDGKVCGIIPKTFIPNYGEFYEKRWFSSAENLNVKAILSADLGFEEEYEIPVGNNLIFKTGDNVAFGAEVCEDLWAPVSPGDFLALNGAQIIFNLSASNELIGKRGYRHDLVKQHSAKNICAYVYASAGKNESTTDLVFSGHSIVAENGTVLCENDKLTDDDYLMIQDIDIGKIKADRRKNKSFSDCAKIFGTHCESENVRIAYKKFTSDAKFYSVNKYPFVPQNREQRIERCMEIFQMQSSALAKRLRVTGAKPVVGVSGGLDSTLALLVCAKTARDIKMPSEEVIGITMPCFGTSDRTYNNSIKLMNALKVTNKEINIKNACIGHFEDIGHDINKHDLTYENSQARERTQVLMDYAGGVGGLVVGTGDLSELTLGWCTYNADHMSMYGVNCGIPKTLVKWMIDSIISYDIFPEATEVLKDIVDTPISPELLPPDEDGKISQQTEDIVGPYELHDFFLYNMLRFAFSPSKIYFLAKKAFCGEYDEEVILKWLKSFYRRFFTQQFKRSCLPDGVKVGSVCLSPRGDWRMPSDASFAMWMNEVNSL